MIIFVVFITWCCFFPELIFVFSIEHELTEIEIFFFLTETIIQKRVNTFLYG